MELIGQLESIIFRNESNAYTVAEFEVDSEIYTIVGYMPFISEGDCLKIIGQTIEHKEYGTQIQVKKFEKLMPLTLKSLEKYLASGNIKGVGEKLANKIITTFGDETINIFKLEPHKLANIRGITREKAIEISTQFIENWEIWQIVGFLEKIGISTEYTKKVYDVLGNNTIEQIEQNPYILIDIVRGVDFVQIDKMALKLGIDNTNEKRIKSGIKYGLIKSTLNGHSCVEKEELIRDVMTLLHISKELVEENLISLNVKNEIVIEQRKEIKNTKEEIKEKLLNEYVYISTYYLTEKEIANRLKLLKNAKNTKHIKNIGKDIKKINKNLDIELSEKQKEAVELVNENNVVIITGGPGTGKTTIIKTIIEIYEQKDKKVVLAAPTGRAAKRMTETTGKEASTLHRLLEIGKIDEDNLFKENTNYQGAPIDGDIIIIDEVSMVDMFLISYLLKGIYQGSKLILVGDKDQLASVGPGSILKDLIESKEIPTIHLNKIFRQAAKSKIILNAHNVNNGEKLILKAKGNEEELKEDFFFIKQTAQKNMIEEIISLCTGRLKKFGNYDFFENIQVLSPTKKGLLGTRELNKELQAKLNPYSDNKLERQAMGVIYRIGDRVMQIKNNYDIYWEKELKGKVSHGTGVFNGEFGTITNIYENEKQLEIIFDDKKIAIYEFSELDQIEHSYVVTIHKAQGSEFDVVILAVPQSAPMLLTRNLLYTGITRAKKLLILVGNDKVLEYMIQNVDSKKRNTGLEYKMK